MNIAQTIKDTYEGIGIAVLDVQPIPGTPLFEMEFINAEGHFKKPVIIFFVIANGPDQCQKQASS